MRLLIVDDEDYTREGLVESIPWNDYEINEIRQARDGKEALETALIFEPDIVLTDIRMPRLNGIEFAEKLIKQIPDCKLLFISGYMEIEYLKSSIRLAAIDYIEKPINIAVLEVAIKKAVESIKEKKKQNLSNEERKELKRQKLVNMLSYNNKDVDAIYRLCQEISYPINNKYIAIVIWDKQTSYSEENNIKRITAFWKENNYDAICSYIGDNKYFLIMRNDQLQKKKVNMVCQSLISKEKNFCIGIGYIVNNLIGISESFNAAILNIEFSFYTTEISIFGLEDKDTVIKSIDPSLYTEFNSMMKDKPKELFSWMEKLFNEICKRQCYRKEHLLILFLNFAKTILKEKRNLITKLKDIYNEDDVEKNIMQAVSIFEVKNFILLLIKEYEQEFEEEVKYSKIVREVINYVDSHYTEVDLSIEDIAGYMHFSSAHLSVLFKQETGVTIKQYISDYRLELSKKMLENERYRINEIAELCGYSNANYFAKVFKMATDLSPVEYRKKFY